MLHGQTSNCIYESALYQNPLNNIWHLYVGMRVTRATNHQINPPVIEPVDPTCHDQL
jgi:hypothetical protein